MRSLAAILLALTLGPAAAAQVSFAPLVGYADRAPGPTLGLALEAGVPLYGSPVAPSARALVEYVFTDEPVDVVHVNLDAILRLRSRYGGSIEPYAKGGLAATSVDRRFGRSDTDLALNVGGGIEVSRFFAEGEYAFGDYYGARARVGYRF